MAANLIEFEFQFKGKRYKDATQGLAALSDVLKRGPERGMKALMVTMREYLEAVAEAQGKRHGNPYPAGTTPTSLSRRSGNLVARIKEGVKVTRKLNASGSVYGEVEGTMSGPFYARIHEYGGVIKPKRAKYLTVPLPAALNANGTPKQRRARDWANTFILKSKKGNLLIVQKVGRDIVPLYVLKTSVKIPPRLMLGTTLNAGLGYFTDKAVDAMYRALTEEAGL